MASKKNELNTPKLGDNISPEDLKSIRSIAKKIRDGDCVLFLGAGANSCSPAYNKYYQDSERPPTARELRDIIRDSLEDLNVFENEPDVNLSRVAQYKEVESDRQALSRILDSTIKIGKKPSPILIDLAQMPFTHIMTTNYDQLFEAALNAITKPFHIGIYQRDRDKRTTNYDDKQITSDTPFLYKVHGDIDDKYSIVLTDEDYIHFILRMSDKDDYNPIPRSFTNAFTEKSILFVGYRLMDYNLRLLFKTIRWGKDNALSPRNYSIDPSPDVVVKRVVMDNYYRTNFLILDSWKLIPYLYEEVFDPK